MRATPSAITEAKGKEVAIAEKQQSLAPVASPSVNPMGESQAELFSREQTQEQTRSLLLAYEKKPGEFSGAIIERDREKVELILELLVDPNITHREIARRMKVSRNTVAALERRADTDGRLATYRQRALEKVRVLHRMATDGLMEALECNEIKGKDRAITWGIVSDHLEKFEGMPTQIHEVRREVSADELNDHILRIKQELNEKKVNSIEVESEKK